MFLSIMILFIHSCLAAMLVALLPLLVFLLVGLPSTVTAKTLDHQQLDISGAIGTNPASPHDFGSKLLSKHPTHSAVDPSKFDRLRVQNLHPKSVITEKSGSIANKDKLEIHHLSEDTEGRIHSSFKIHKESETKSKSSFPCPEPTDIEPCTCFITAANELTLDCSAVESLEQLGDVFRKDFPVIQFDEFRINNNNNIKYLADIFNGVSFRSISLNDVFNLTEITTYALSDSKDSLENVYVHGSALDENTFPFSTLDQFPKLISLTISASNLAIWPAFLSSSIEYISFYDNHVTSLPAGKEHMSVNAAF